MDDNQKKTTTKPEDMLKGLVRPEKEPPLFQKKRGEYTQLLAAAEREQQALSAQLGKVSERVSQLRGAIFATNELEAMEKQNVEGAANKDTPSKT